MKIEKLVTKGEKFLELHLEIPEWAGIVEEAIDLATVTVKRLCQESRHECDALAGKLAELNKSLRRLQHDHDKKSLALAELLDQTPTPEVLADIEKAKGEKSAAF